MGSTENYRMNVASLLARAELRFVATLHQVILVLCLVLFSLFVQGCASGGYPGGGVSSLSATTITLDAAQSIAVGANTSGAVPVSWTFNGTCPASGCGSLSSSTGTNITYTAPASVTNSFQTQLSAAAAGTTNARTVTISVNPAPTLTGTPPPGSVGMPYSFTFTTSGGTSPLKFSVLSGTLPAGLTFNATTATVSGTPTAAGASSFVLQLVDKSDVPFTLVANKTITIAASGSTTSLSVSGTLPKGTVGTAYSGSLQATGGTAPYTWSVASGTLPAGLSLNAGTGAITGTPSTTGTANVVIQARDAAGNTGTAPYAIFISATGTAPLNIVVSGTVPNGSVGTPYTTTLQATGGTAPYSWSVVNGTLPAGLNLNASTGVIAGSPTSAGTANVVIQARDTAGNSGTASYALTITATSTSTPLTLSGTLPSGTVGSPYSGTLQATGGTAPYTWSIASGALPSGLSLNPSTGVISGSPSAAGTANFVIQAQDSAGNSGTGAYAVAVTAAGGTTSLTVSGSVPGGTVGSPYSATLQASGGTAPYAWSISSGMLPSGLTLNSSTGVISGTPTAAGTANVVVQAQDAAGKSGTGAYAIAIASTGGTTSLTVSGSVPSGTVGSAYSATLQATGGTAPYTWSVASGVLPAGLSLNAGTGVISGVPSTAGTANVVIQAQDAAGNSGTGSYGIVIAAAGGTVTVSISGNVPSGSVGSAYSAALQAMGGTAPYTWSVASGMLPAGLSLNASTGVISGTPTVAGTVNVTIQARDTGGNNGTGSYALNISGGSGSSPINVTSGMLPNGTVGTPYMTMIGVTGGTAPYTCTLSNGMLPTGLTLNANCSIAGTPTAAGTSTVSVTVTDASNPAQTKTASETITVNSAPQGVMISSPLPATVNTPYTGTLPITGGTAPYTCILASGTLPAGLTLSANCTITGTPTAPGSTTVTVKATDSSNPTQSSSGSVTVVVNPQPSSLTLGNPPVATVNTPYTGTIPVTGGSGSYTCSLSSGTLPSGLVLGTTCTITGTPTATGSSTVQVTVTDSTAPGTVKTGPVTVSVQPIPTLTFTGSLPNAVVNQPYTQTLQAAGGVGPYTYTVMAGALPTGLTLSSAGVVSGTPTVPGASGFTVTATDSEGTPQTVSLPLTLLVTYAPAVNNSLLQGPYAFLFQGYDDVAVGVLAYQTATAGSITADGNGAITAGEEDSNHQVFNPTGKTVATRKVLGTYSVGADRRGLLTLTAFDASGAVLNTTTYAISLRAAVTPATNSTTGSLIEADGDQLVGTKGSGMLLAQTPGAFTTGLAGSYAFGITGDTPCLPTCTVGIAAGPAATVGQFTATGGTASGTADANIGSNNVASSALSGTYTAADNNGRVQLTLLNAKLSGVPFPTDYAAYVVDANRVILLSTDKHSTYVLQAGTAQLQRQTTFSNASLGAAYVGYENSPVNPGLLNTTLQNVLNLSTATVFRGVGNGNGICSTTNVDSSGATGVVNSLGGLVSAPVINAVLGSYQALGDSACTVAANGRAVLNYAAPSALLQLTLTGLGLPTTPAPRVVYLTDTNSGYFLETGYAGLGMLEAQTGAPFSNASLNGTYVYGSIPASTLATINSSGEFTADGAGNITSTVDRNVGVGNINVLQLGITATTIYNITSTTAGRFLLGSGEVVYEIEPGRFALLEPELLNTSAYVALLF